MFRPMKGIVIVRKLNKALLQHSLITIYKSFVRTHLDYGDIIYDQPNRKISIKKLKEFNVMLLLLQLQVPSKELIRAGYRMNYVLNLLYLGVGLGNRVPFVKSKQQVYHSTFLILFRKSFIT